MAANYFPVFALEFKICCRRGVRSDSPPISDESHGDDQKVDPRQAYSRGAYLTRSCR